MNELDTTKGNLNVLASDIKHLIEQSRNRVAVQVNSAATILYWNIGKRIREEVLKGQRAEYGKRVLSELGKELTTTFGRGWGERTSSFSFPPLQVYGQCSHAAIPDGIRCHFRCRGKGKDGIRNTNFQVSFSLQGQR